MGGKHVPRDPGSLKMIENIYSQAPSFTDIFDEDTFYIFVTFFVAGVIVLTFIASRFITIKPVD